MAEARRELLSVAAFFIIIVIAILLYAIQIIADWVLLFPLVIGLYGAWLLLLALIRSSNPQKYERDAFSTFSLGLLLVALGGAWFLLAYNWLFSIFLILAVIAVLAIVAALKRK